MAEAMRQYPANPSSVEHLAGSAAAATVSAARENIANFVGCRPREVIFTSGSTEANNLAILGLAPALKSTGRSRIVISAIEHPSVFAPAEHLREQGFELVIVPVQVGGQIDLQLLETMITEQTGLVSIMAANNETGIIQPLKTIGEFCRRAGSFFHSDFSQAGAYLPVSPNVNGLHLVSLSGHKMYGPKGVGVLYRRLRKPRVNLVPIIHGGGHEHGVRSGSLNLPGIVGMAEACAIAVQRRDEEWTRLEGLKHLLTHELTSRLGAVVNGDQTSALPHAVSLSIEDLEPLALVHALREKVIFSASSACSTEEIKTSHVLLNMYGECARASRAFRLGLGRSTTAEDIAAVVTAFERASARLRSAELSFSDGSE